MATEDTEATQNEATLYEFQGMKDPSDRTARLILEGSTTNPTKYVDRGDTIAFTDEEVKAQRDKGRKFKKVGDAEPESTDEGSNEPETKAEGQEAQVASGAQHAAATAEKDNTPAGRADSPSQTNRKKN